MNYCWRSDFVAVLFKDLIVKRNELSTLSTIKCDINSDRAGQLPGPLASLAGPEQKYFLHGQSFPENYKN